ncbi:MAG: AraC family transcriptional regulator [Myxococcota bacterium]
MSQSWAERILKTLDEIQTRLDDEDLDPASLAENAGFSRHHFHRVFRGMTGESVMGFVRRLRLERAAQRLRFGQAPVTDVAFASGYQSHEAFTRAFRDRFGTSPRDFRADFRHTIDKDIDAWTEERSPVVVVSLRHVGCYDTCFDTWDTLIQRLGDFGLLERMRRSFGLVYDDQDITRLDQLRYDACVELDCSPGDALPPEFQERTIPGGRYAIVRHTGPYDTMVASYIALLGGWLPHRGVELYDEPVVEVYLNDPRAAAPHELISEISVRIT